MEIFKLFGSILVDSTEAQKSISNTGKEAEGVSSKLGAGIATAGKWALGVGAAAAAVGGAMFGVATKTADALGEIDDMAQRTGVTAEEFQKYAYAAKLSGMETATLEKAMVKAQKSFADASTGGKAAGDAFKQLGVDVSTMTSDGAFDAAISALADMDDVTQRNALANDIFGKSYAELAPLLNLGSEGISALKEEAVGLGAVISNDAVEAGASFGDSLDRMKTAVDGVFNKVGVELIPVFQSMADWVVEHMPQIQETIGTVFGAIETVASAVYGVFKEYVLPILMTLFGWVQDNMPAIKKTVSTVFEAILEVVGGVWSIFKDNLIPILEALWDFISPTFPLIQGAVELAFGAVVTVVQTVVDIFDDVTSAIKTAVEWLTTWNEMDETSKKNSRSSWDGGVDGSHASGLPFVPYDGYRASLHRGETVLSAGSSQDMVSSIVNGVVAAVGAAQGGGSSGVAKVYLDSREIAKAIFEPLKNESRQRGVPLTT